MRALFLINPPERRGYSNERSLSGGLGVSRKLKFRERPLLFLPPTDLMLTAAVAEKCGLSVDILDLILEKQEGEAALAHCRRRIREQTGSGTETGDETWVGVRISIPTLPADLQFANDLKASLPQTRVFLFGSVIQSTLDHWVKEAKVDAVLYGEAEAVVGPMLSVDGGAWKRQPGVIDPQTYLPLSGDNLFDGKLQDRFGKWIMVDNITELPFPAYHLLPMERYSITGETKDCTVFVTASRGCPIGCTMCPYMLHEGRTLRTSAADRVLDEMEWLNKTYGIYQWRFRDPNFAFDRKQAREVLNGVIERGIKMSACVEGSLECMDDDLIRLMAKAGVNTITTGIETADEACLASIGQKIKINSIISQKIALATSLGIHVYGTFVVGAPEESWETVLKTIEYSKTIECECTFTVMTPFPGTPMYYRALEEGLLNKEMTYAKWNSYEATVRTRFLTADDLSLARLWARLELIIPYRIERARKYGGSGDLVKAQLRLIPHRIVRAGVRTQVAWRRWKGSPRVEVPDYIANKKIEKIPLHRISKQVAEKK